MNINNQLPFPLLYEDNHLIVVVKPAGTLSQADYTKDDDMLTILKQWLKVKYNKQGDVYLGLVHRLDRMTSGVMVFAKTSKAAARLSEQIRQNAFNKQYLAVVHGKIEAPKEIILENYLSKDEVNVMSSVVSQEEGKLSQLTYQSLAYRDDLTLLKINLITGRHHQIRVQMAHLGHPLVGDRLYGSTVKDNIALTAYEISFLHPISKQLLTFTYMQRKGIWKYFD